MGKWEIILGLYQSNQFAIDTILTFLPACGLRTIRCRFSQAIFKVLLDYHDGPVTPTRT